MSKELLHKYRFYDRAIHALLLFTGLWPNANPTFLYRLLPLLHSTIGLITSLAILNFCRFHSSNLNLFLKGLSIALSFLTMVQKLILWDAILYAVEKKIFKNTRVHLFITFGFINKRAICLTCYRKRLAKLHASLAVTFVQDLDDSELRPFLLSPLLSIYRPSLALSIVTCFINAVYLVLPGIAMAIQVSRGVNPIKRLLPYPAIFPWAVEGIVYPTYYAFEIYAGICLGSFTSLIDSLFGYYIFQICGQLRTLSYRLRNLSSCDNHHEVIRNCVARHQILTRCQQNLERIYGPIVLWMLVTNAIVMCALIYQAVHMRPEKAAVIVIYILMKSVQTLLYGWFGTFLATENNSFREAIYSSDWAGSGEKCLMTDILIMMTYKPFVLKACSMVTISVDMFLAVSNTALSYFFMLRTVEESNKQ